MSDTANAAADDKADLDAIVVANDAESRAYIYHRLAIRRRMAVATFIHWIVGNSVLITAGLTSDAVAQRAIQLSTIIGTWEMACMGIIGWYWGCGAYEHGSSGMFGGGYGGGSYGGYGNNSYRPQTTFVQPQKSSRAD